MTPTRPTLLVVLALLASAIGWSTVGLVASTAGRTLPVPWSAAIALLIVAVALFLWGLLARPRLRGQPGVRRMSPFVAARTAALAMAASRTGALVGGFYGGVGVALLPEIANPFVQERAWASGAAVVAALVMVLAALWLEHVCRIPGDKGGREAGADSDPGEDDPADWAYPSVVTDAANDR